MILYRFSALTFLATAISTVTATTCYCKNNNTISSGCYGGLGGVPCTNSTNGEFVQCCAKGDICGEDGFCHYTHAQVEGSGYYIGGCSDPDYQDSVCSTGCTTELAPDVVYNSQTELWACCSGAEGGTNCSQPLSDTFQAPPPEVLFATSTTSKTTSTPTSTPTSSPTTTSSSSTTTTPASSSTSSSSSLSTGAAAGIGVGVALGLIALASIIAFICIRRRRKNKIANTQPQYDDQAYNSNTDVKDAKYDTSRGNKDQYYEAPMDKGGRMYASELPGREPSELAASPRGQYIPRPIELAER